MANPLEWRTLNKSIDELRGAVSSLAGKYGDNVVVKRLRNDLERLVMDVEDVEKLPEPKTGGPTVIHELDDKPYDESMWATEDLDEGLGRH
jgi:hypothetical protein